MNERLPMYHRGTLCTASALVALAGVAAQPASAQNYSFQTVDAPGVDHSVGSIFHSTWRTNTGLLLQQYFDSNPPNGWGRTACRRGGAWSIIDVPGSIWCGAGNPNS